MAERVWIINPYGSLPGEPWATYRSTMVAEALAGAGHDVTQFISNVEHRSKRVRPLDAGRDARGYHVEIVPSTSYRSHISWQRVHYERTFARRLLTTSAGWPPPDVVILAEPALFYFDVLWRPLLQRPGVALVLDLIDIWPELFELVVPEAVRPLTRPLLSPLYRWRRRLYRRADGVVAVAESYARLAADLVRPDVPVDVVHWSYDERQDAGDEGPGGQVVDALIAAKQPGEVWALYAGTLGENYDVPALLHAARSLPPALRDKVQLRFVIAGDGPLAAECRAQQGEALVFVGRLAGPELARLHRHADIALSTYRGASTVAMPIKAFEYFRHGLPVVNSLGRDMGAIVAAEQAGLNYDPADRGALPAAIERLAVDQELRCRMAAGAWRLARRFSRDEQYARFVRMVERVGRRGDSRPGGAPQSLA